MRHRVSPLRRFLTRSPVIRGGRDLWRVLSAPVTVQIMAVAVTRGCVLSLSSKHFGLRGCGEVQLMKHVTLSRGRVNAWVIVLCWLDRPEMDPVAVGADRT